MDYKIKHITENNIESAMQLVGCVFDEFVAPYYTQQGVDEFKTFIAIDSIKSKIKTQGLQLFGAFDKNKIIGIVALIKPLHISLLFVAKNYQRQGIAKNLFQIVWQNRIDEKTITVSSSPYALEVYKKLGFVIIDKERIKNGIRYIPIPMHYCF